MPPLSTWSLRRVLLAGTEGRMMHAMRAQLLSAGARVHPAIHSLSEELLCRTLHAGRYSCVIIPELTRLCPGNAQTRLAALSMLLDESREAGVPLAMLLGAQSSRHAEEISTLFSHAQGWAHGAFGDPVSVQCILHAHPQPETICRKALLLGARFLAGDTSCTGYFSL